LDKQVIAELLKKLRGRLAYVRGVEPYVIFKDTEFESLMEVQPKSLQELATIKGFPADGKRVQNWGQAIVDIFTKSDQVTEFEVEPTGVPDEYRIKTRLKPMSLF
jgi:ribonuclease D